MNLGQLQEWVDAGRLDTGRVLTMRDLRDHGVVHKKIPHGVKLLAKARCEFASGVVLDGASPWRLRMEEAGIAWPPFSDNGVQWPALPLSGCLPGHLQGRSICTALQLEVMRVSWGLAACHERRSQASHNHRTNATFGRAVDLCRGVCLSASACMRAGEGAIHGAAAAGGEPGVRGGAGGYRGGGRGGDHRLLQPAGPARAAQAGVVFEEGAPDAARRTPAAAPGRQV